MAIIRNNKKLTIVKFSGYMILCDVVQKHIEPFFVP